MNTDDMKNIERMFGDAKQVSLSNEEREALKTRVRLFMNAYPARAPFSIRALDRFSDAVWDFGHARVLGMSVKPLTYALVALLSVGVGTSYAAERALPGDALYSVKTQVNEKVSGALAVSMQDKLDWNTALTERRLEEAETLAAQGRLTPLATSQIESGLNESTNDFNVDVESLTGSPTNDALIVDARSSLEASLNAHEQVLTALSAALPEAKQAIQPVLGSVQTHAKRAQLSRQSAEDALASHGDLKKYASKKKKDAEQALARMQLVANENGSALGTSTSQEASTSASTTARSITEGDTNLSRGDFKKALTTFQAAIRSAQETQVNLEIRKRLMDENNISLGGLLSNTGSSEQSNGDGDSGRSE